jgi:hypothetical protein
MQCPNVTVVACLTLLPKLDDINNNAIERAAGLISTRTTTNVFLYLALDAWNAVICLLTTLAIGAYLKTYS